MCQKNRKKRRKKERKNQRSPKKKVNDDGTILNKVYIYILRHQVHILSALPGRLGSASFAAGLTSGKTVSEDSRSPYMGTMKYSTHILIIFILHTHINIYIYLHIH